MREGVNLEMDLEAVRQFYRENPSANGFFGHSNALTLLAALEAAEADAARLREALGLVLPMAKRYAAAHQAGVNQRIVQQAEDAVAPQPAPVVAPVRWMPNDCRDPVSCDQHKACMYLGCSHGGEPAPEPQPAAREMSEPFKDIGPVSEDAWLAASIVFPTDGPKAMQFARALERLAQR